MISVSSILLLVFLKNTFCISPAIIFSFLNFGISRSLLQEVSLEYNIILNYPHLSAVTCDCVSNFPVCPFRAVWMLLYLFSQHCCIRIYFQAELFLTYRWIVVLYNYIIYEWMMIMIMMMQFFKGKLLQ